MKWSWDKPTEPGMYLCCFGDVVTEENANLVRCHNSPAGYLVDESYTAVKYYNSGCKWLRLDISELNKLPND